MTYRYNSAPLHNYLTQGLPEPVCSSYRRAQGYRGSELIPRSKGLRFLLTSTRFRLLWRRVLSDKIARCIKGRLDDANMRELEPMDNQVRLELQNYYHEDIKKLVTMTGRNLSNWLD